MAKKKTTKPEIKPESEFNPEKPEIGFYNLPESVYRPAPGCNWSSIKRIQKTPKTYRWFADNPSGDSPARKLGRLFHTEVLEPDLVHEQYAVRPHIYEAKGKKKDDPMQEKPWNMNATFCKEWVAEMEEKGFEIIKPADAELVNGMREALWELADARAIMEDADGYEISAFWTDEETGLLCKCKLDILKNGQIGDLKKTAAGDSPSGSWDKWCSTVRNYKYHGQAAFYRNGVNAVYKHLGLDLPEIPMFQWLVVEDARPYDTAIYSIYDTPEANSYQFFVWGRDLCRFLLSQVQLWQKHKSWPSYNVGPSGMTEDHELEVPDWLSLEIR